MSSVTGSYTYGQFVSNEAELSRLESQATVAWAVESRALVRAGLRRGMDVLDAACGPGFITARIADIVGPDGSMIGADINQDLLAVARSHPRRDEAAAVDFRCMDVYEIDLPAASVDFVYARFLFQHLERPARAVEQIRRVLRPGGRVSIIDVDDGVLGILPEPPGFSEFAALAAESQRRRGGDRRIGRKLGHLLKAAGFGDLEIEISVVTSEQIGMQAFLDITTGFKREIVSEAQRPAAEKALESIYRHALAADGLGTVGVYCVSGAAP